jgi:hypothetical protein
MATKSQFWAVKWGENIRVSDRTSDPVHACKYCYGMASSDMQVSPLGGNRKGVMKAIHAGLVNRTDWKPARST